MHSLSLHLNLIMPYMGQLLPFVYMELSLELPPKWFKMVLGYFWRITLLGLPAKMQVNWMTQDLLQLPLSQKLQSLASKELWEASLGLKIFSGILKQFSDTSSQHLKENRHLISISKNKETNSEWWKWISISEFMVTMLQVQ